MKKFLILGVLALSPLVARADSRLENAAERVENRIESDYLLRPFNFETDTIGRTIRIRGAVNTRAQRQRAFNIARRYSGGYRLQNRITVRNRYRR